MDWQCVKASNSQPIEVFNLEIFGQHVYQITTGGMLVHNAGAGGSGSTSVFHGTTDAETVTTVGLSMRTLKDQGGELADTAGFSVTPYRDIAEGFAAGRAIERGGTPTIIETTIEELAERGISLRSGTGLTEAGELKIDPADFARVTAGTFTRSQ